MNDARHEALWTRVHAIYRELESAPDKQYRAQLIIELHKLFAESDDHARKEAGKK